jgi:hypothetical protein
VPVGTTLDDVLACRVDDAGDRVIPCRLFERFDKGGVFAADIVVDAARNKVALDGVDNLWVTQNLSTEITAALSAGDFLKQEEDILLLLLCQLDGCVEIPTPRN